VNDYRGTEHFQERMLPRISKALRRIVVSVTAVPKLSTHKLGSTFKRRSLTLITGTGGFYKMDANDSRFKAYMLTRFTVHERTPKNICTYFEIDRSNPEDSFALSRLSIRFEALGGGRAAAGAW
jgi:hypothetical protein